MPVSRSLRLAIPPSMLPSIVWILSPSTPVTIPTWSMWSILFEPLQSKKTMAPGLGTVPQASCCRNHWAWWTV